MRAGNHNRLAGAQKKIVERIRHGAEGNALVEHVFQLDVSARDCVSHHHPVGARLQIGFCVGLRNRNRHGRQEIRHRRIRGNVRARYFQTSLLEQSRQRRHGRSANSNDVYVLLIH
jgi:hypothetical protein